MISTGIRISRLGWLIICLSVGSLLAIATTKIPVLNFIADDPCTHSLSLSFRQQAIAAQQLKKMVTLRQVETMLGRGCPIPTNKPGQTAYVWNPGYDGRPIKILVKNQKIIRHEL